MSDYNAIYDAIRHSLRGCDIGAAVENVLRNENFGHYAMMAGEVFRGAVSEYERPSVLYRPTLYVDGDKWCALLGENIQIGVVGFGASPDEAMRAFDTAWFEKLPQKAEV